MYVSNQYKYNEESFSTSQEEKFDKKSLENLKKHFSLSRDKENIVVIVLDAFPTEQFNWILEKHPEFNDTLDGFTWYRNTVSTGNFTTSGEPALVGGHTKTVGKINERGETSLHDVIQTTLKKHSDHFTSQKFEMDYFNPSWVKAEDFIEKINPNLLTEGAMVNYLLSDPPDHVSEKTIKALETNKVPIEYPFMLLNYLSLIKASPFFLKQYIYKRFRMKTEKPRMVSKTFRKYLGVESFFHSLNMLTNSEAVNPKFHFFWHDVTVRPLGINKKGDGPPFEEMNNGTFTDDNAVEYTVDYVFKQLERFFNKLKKLNIYDSTNIILVGDHGSAPYGPGWNKSAIYALLMVKEINARGSMRIDNETLMSNADLFAITSRMASGQSADIICDPTQISIDRELEYWVTTHGNWDSLLKNKFDVDYVVRVKNHVYNENEWEIIDY